MDQILRDVAMMNQSLADLTSRITVMENRKSSTGALSDTDRTVLDRAAAFLDKWEPVAAAPGK